jgi:hypothetical protein
VTWAVERPTLSSTSRRAAGMPLAAVAISSTSASESSPPVAALSSAYARGAQAMRTPRENVCVCVCVRVCVCVCVCVFVFVCVLRTAARRAFWPQPFPHAYVRHHSAQPTMPLATQCITMPAVSRGRLEGCPEQGDSHMNDVNRGDLWQGRHTPTRIQNPNHTCFQCCHTCLCFPLVR